MIQDLFLTYEMSLIAKEKRFDEPCFARYIKKEFRFAALGGVTNFTKEQPGQISAPLYQQIISWLKKEHKILISELWDGWDWAKEDEDFSFCLTLDEAIKNAFKLIK